MPGNKKPRFNGVFNIETILKFINTLNYQNFHQGFLVAVLLLVAAVVLAAALLFAAPVAALVTLSFRPPIPAGQDDETAVSFITGVFDSGLAGLKKAAENSK